MKCWFSPIHRFEEQETPGSRSFFTEIIASISDIKFAKAGRYILSRDYMTLKVGLPLFSVGLNLFNWLIWEMCNVVYHILDSLKYCLICISKESRLLRRLYDSSPWAKSIASLGHIPGNWFRNMFNEWALSNSSLTECDLFCKYTSVCGASLIFSVQFLQASVVFTKWYQTGTAKLSRFYI